MAVSQPATAAAGVGLGSAASAHCTVSQPVPRTSRPKARWPPWAIAPGVKAQAGSICMITALGSVKNSRLKLPRPTPDARGTGTAELRAQIPDEEAVHPDRADVESGRQIGRA